MKAQITAISVAGVQHIAVLGISVNFNETKEEVVSKAKKGDGNEKIFGTITYKNLVFNKEMQEEHLFDITTGRTGTVVALRTSKKDCLNLGGKLFTDIQIDK